jgi:ABC-type amino acid transport substrate-binding protein
VPERAFVTRFRRLHRLSCTAAVVASLTLVSCAGGGATGSPSPAVSNAGFKLVTPGTLTVAIAASAAPAITISGTSLGGLDGALITAFARDHHLHLRLYQTNLAAVVLALQEGKADLGTGYASTAAPSTTVFYTYPYFWERAAVFTETGIPYAGPNYLGGGKVGAVAGSPWGPYLQRVLKTSAVLFPTAAAAASALINGQLQGYVNYSDNEGLPPINNSPNFLPNLIQPGQFGMPTAVLNALSYNIVQCGNKGLAQALDDEMTKLHKGSPSPWDAVLAINGLPRNVDPPLQTPQQGCP